MSQLSTAATHCKFEASDSASDEVVLLKILDVLRNCLTGKLAGVLSDESVCEMMETGLSMCCQMRLSGAGHHFLFAACWALIQIGLQTEMLRRSAERTMQAMIAAVFSQLRYLPVEADPSLQSERVIQVKQDQATSAGVKMSLPTLKVQQRLVTDASEAVESTGTILP